MARSRKTPPNIPAIAEKLFGKPERRYLNRELSWLAFNARVIEEANNVRHPLLERVRFLSISASNMDEFFMVRVAGLNDQLKWDNPEPSHDGMSPAQQLTKILARAGELMQWQQESWLTLRAELAGQGIEVLDAAAFDEGALNESDMAWLKAYFFNNIFATLTPIAIDPAHPFPFLPNRSMSAIFDLRHQERGKRMIAVLPFPNKLGRFVKLPARHGKGAHPSSVRLVQTETLIQIFLDSLFPGYEVLASGTFRVLRDSDLEVSDEAEDLVRTYEKAVKDRKRGEVIRLKVARHMTPFLQRFVAEKLEVPPEYIIEVEGMLGLAALSELCDIDRPDLKFLPYTPRYPERISDFNGDCLAAIAAKDIVIHHPYESFDVVVQFLRQAAQDEDVISIKQTLYRTSNNSSIVKALVEAAESGKAVTAVVELSARFDEEANIRWARDLEHAGAQVVYGIVNMKTHAKISLVTKRIHKENGETSLKSYVHFGTGNYHPVTAKIYTDLSFFTCDPELCRDAAVLFNYLTGYAPPVGFSKLIMAPHNMRETFMALIDNEIAHARAGRPASIWAKMNALVDSQMMDALYRASTEGVKIDLVVRGVCCLRPGIKGLSENIRIKSIVGRFLEHSRIYCFGNGHAMPSNKARVFISSADWMNRNLSRRVEFMVEIENATVHEQVLDQIMAANMLDNLQSWEMDGDGHYARLQPGDHPFSAHEYFMTNPSLSGRGKALKQSFPSLRSGGVSGGGLMGYGAKPEASVNEKDKA
ncbi:RNA degradosome polyphosphate kinase [bacterium]|nr:RNA degradosome polyphosphate kinase [bacterium]